MNIHTGAQIDDWTRVSQGFIGTGTFVATVTAPFTLEASLTGGSVRTNVMPTGKAIDTAVGVRNTALADILELPSGVRNDVSTVVGGVNIRTGETAVGIKIRNQNYGLCAEDLVVQQLACNPDDIVMSYAIRPRTLEVVPVCPRCQAKFPPGMFPPGGQFIR